MNIMVKSEGPGFRYQSWHIYPDWGILWCASVPSSKCSKSNL